MSVFIFMRIPLMLIEFVIQMRIDYCVLPLRQFYSPECVPVPQLSPQQQK
jgi:hypothetical protein